MMNTGRLVMIFLTVLAGWCTGFAFADAEASAAQVLYPAGSQKSFEGPEAYFTGDVHVDMLFPANETAHFSGAYVTFEPGARTAWHLHPAGQHMIVTSGVCLTGTRDGKVIECNVGETVWCPPNIDHWHGASPDQAMTHLVVTGVLDDKAVIWKEKVSDAQYYGRNAQKGDTMKELQGLNPKQEAIIPIAAFTAAGELENLKTALQDGLEAGLTVNEIKEIQVHLYAYAGFPRALNGLSTFMAVLEARKAKGITDETGKDATPLPTDKSSLELGTEVQTHLVGQPVSGPLYDFAPAIDQFLKSHLFGDLFGRDVLDYKAREIATLSALSSIEGVEPQLKAHVMLSFNAGLTETQAREVVAVLEAKTDKQKSRRAEEALQEVLQKK